MNNQTYTDSTETQVQDYNQQQAAAALISFIVVAITIGVAIALLVASQQQRKPKTLREKVEYNLRQSSEATAQAFKQLSKDIAELRRTIDDRLESLR